MEARPRLKPARTALDRFLDLAGWLAVAGTWVLVVTTYSQLPGTIPTHYNGAGEADGFGAKATILTLPLVATVLVAGLALVSRFPHLFNYPTAITNDNALRQYTNAVRFISYLKLLVAVIFGGIAFRTVQHAFGQAAGLGTWFLPAAAGLLFLSIAWFISKSTKTH